MLRFSTHSFSTVPMPIRIQNQANSSRSKFTPTALHIKKLRDARSHLLSTNAIILPRSLRTMRNGKETGGASNRRLSELNKQEKYKKIKIVLSVLRRRYVTQIYSISRIALVVVPLISHLILFIHIFSKLRRINLESDSVGPTNKDKTL